MGRPAATPEHRRARRQRIRAAAAQIHAERGLQAVSVRAIAQRAGVSTGAVYTHFSSLAELMQSLWQEPVARANERLETLATGEPDPQRRIEALLRAYADFAHERPELLRGSLLFVRPATIEAPEPEPLRELGFFRLLHDAVGEAQKQGSVRRGDAEQLAVDAWASVHGALALPVNMDRHAFPDPRALTGSAIDAALRALAPGE